MINMSVIRAAFLLHVNASLLVLLAKTIMAISKVIKKLTKNPATPTWAITVEKASNIKGTKFDDSLITLLTLNISSSINIV